MWQFLATMEDCCLKANATNVRGIYPVKIMNLPKEFCVVVTDVD